jgi:hypothetical protein
VHLGGRSTWDNISLDPKDRWENERLFKSGKDSLEKLRLVVLTYRRIPKGGIDVLRCH